jgi:hypothetical protein
MKNSVAVITALVCSFGVASSAFAGGIRIECWGPCNGASPTQICAVGTSPTPASISCDNISEVGIDTGVPCGSGATCFVQELADNKALSWWCDDGPGTDAVVNCR